MQAFSEGIGVLYLLGAVQGVFLAAVLASRPQNSVANRLLAGVMLAFSVDLSMAVYHATGTSASHPALIGLDLPLAVLYGPLLYLYVRTLTEPERPAGRRDLLHFIPFALLVLYFLPFYLKSPAEKLATLRNPSLDPTMATLDVVTPLKLAQALVYIALFVSRLRRHGRRVKDTFSSTDHVTLRWLRDLAVGIVALGALTAALYAFGSEPSRPTIGMDPTGLYDDITLLALTAFVYAIGYIGLRQPEIFTPRPDPGAPAGSAEQVDAVARPRYARSGMDSETSARIEASLLALMEREKPYRRGDLTLLDLADALGVSPHNLTEVVNTRLGQNFYDFVNGYRVREVQARLAEPDADHFTLLAIAMEAGFNSKSAFNAAFRRHAGVTPSAYRERLGEAA